MTAGIDSMILVYAGVVPTGSRKDSRDTEDLQVRSRLLLRQLGREKSPVILPTVAISELLVPVPKAEKGALIAALTEKFLCPTFDVKAAAIAADLWSQHKKLPQDQQYKSRHVLRADAMIVASASAAGATDFYSHDGKCRALASLVMNAHDLPTNDPDDMFALEDIRRGDL